MNSDLFKIKIAQRILGAPAGAIPFSYPGEVPHFKKGGKDLLIWMEDGLNQKGQVTAILQVFCYHYDPARTQFYYSEISEIISPAELIALRRAACDFNGD